MNARRSLGGIGSDILEKTFEVQAKLEGDLAAIKRGKFYRVVKMAKKPDTQEYKKTLLLSAAMMFLIGGIGFSIYLIMNFLPGMITDYFGL